MSGRWLTVLGGDGHPDLLLFRTEDDHASTTHRSLVAALYRAESDEWVPREDMEVVLPPEGAACPDHPDCRTDQSSCRCDAEGVLLGF